MGTVNDKVSLPFHKTLQEFLVTAWDLKHFGVCIC